MATHSAPSTPQVAPAGQTPTAPQATASAEHEKYRPTSASSSQTPPKKNHSQAHKSSPMTAAAADLETYLHQTLNLCNKLAKTNLDDPALTSAEPQQGSVMGLGSEVAAAKMLNYCIRMLHADGWHPPTVIRAMVLREIGLEAGMRSTMYQALRARREEIKVCETRRTGGVNNGVEVMEEKSAKKNGGGNKAAERRGTLSGRSRGGKSMMVKGGAVLDDTMAPGDVLRMAPGSDMTDNPIHQGGCEGVRTGPSTSLI